jgi:hypothetical protein
VKRRTFISLLGSAAAWPLAARAQQSAMPVIGLMGAGSAAAQTHLTSAFLQRFRELGWTESRDVRIEYRWGEGRSERYAEIAASLSGLRSISYSRTIRHRRWRRSRRHRLFQSCSRRRAIPLAPALWRVWRDPAAISPACPVRRPIQRAIASSFCASLSPICGVWLSWQMLTAHSLLAT